MALRPVNTVITLEGDHIVRLQEVLIDEDREGALTFLREVVGEKLRCAQAETHRPEFEGGTGREAAHYLQKGEGHAKPVQWQEAGARRNPPGPAVHRSGASAY